MDNAKPFTLQAKVTPEFTKERLYNAADLFVYANDTLWQKLAFEQDEFGNHRVVSVRTNGTSDDNNHDKQIVTSLYLKISSDTRTIASYYSLDKKEWHMVRLYKNDYPSKLYASDGEIYYITSLFLAAERWNVPRYSEEANRMLEKIMNKDGMRTGVYNLFNRDNKLVTFVPDKIGRKFTDPSYQLPAFLDFWAESARREKSFWKKAAKAARNHLMQSCNPVTGLYPDYSNYDGTSYKWLLASYDTSLYMYDAIRCAMNVGMDYYLYGRDKKRQEEAMARLLRFFESNQWQHGHFSCDGKESFGHYSCGMIGANAVAAFALLSSSRENRKLAKKYVQRLWFTKPPVGKYRYYEGLVYYLSMLHVAGKFKLK